ncbi:hypothetical protein [Spirillospora sp. NPDC029432]|uniref:hypothetical protein n=1 Tax=Spirillospora sp. NPDC029432 TaxID=3154599 RepID=UPI0034532021
MKGPEGPGRPPRRRHKVWPATVITLVLLWILLIFLLVHNGPRLPRWPASAAPAPVPVQGSPGQGFATPSASGPGS